MTTAPDASSEPNERSDPQDKSVPFDVRKAVFAFEGIDERLQLVPLAARRLLDVWGKKLSLAGWLSLAWLDRCTLAAAGLGDHLVVGEPAAVGEVLARANPASTSIDPVGDPDLAAVPADVAASLGPTRSLDAQQWRALRPLERYALAKYAAKPEKLALAYDEIVRPLTHLTSDGHAHMVSVSGKTTSARRAIASARVRTTPAVVHAVASGGLPKGDVVAVARVAGLMAAKRTPELIPLCHPVQTTHAIVDIDADPGGEFRIRATVETVDRTGVEMEAMVAASIAALTLYDMIKSADRWAVLENVQLEEKSGGKSGLVVRPSGEAR